MDVLQAVKMLFTVSGAASSVERAFLHISAQKLLHNENCREHKSLKLRVFN